MAYTAEELLDMLDDDIEAYQIYKDEDYKTREYIAGNQLSDKQIAVLEERGQPIQIYNVFEEYHRKIKGYFTSIKQEPTAKPTQEIDAVKSEIATDLVRFELYRHGWDALYQKVISDMFSGLACIFCNVVETDKKDEYGRKVYEIKIESVPSIEVYPDRFALKADYTDARRISRLKWVHIDTLQEKFKDLDVDAIKTARNNYTNDTYIDFTTRFKEVETVQDEDMYLLAHTVTKELKDDKFVWVSYYWVENYIIDRKEMVYEFLEQPYILQKTIDNDAPGYYGLMHNHFGTQDAINQAVQHIQLMISSVRAIVDENTIPDNLTLEQFKSIVFRPNSLIPVKNIGGLQLDKLITEVQNYYVAIDRYLDIIQRSIGINDAFMGLAPAASSGKKVQLQQQSAIVALEYFATPLQNLVKNVGKGIIALAKQYYRANQIIRLTDKHNGDKYIELNKPLMHPIIVNGREVRDFLGNTIEVPFIQIATDPETEEFLKDEDGNYILEPATDPNTSIAFGEYDIMVVSGNSGIGEQEERNNLMELLQIGAGAMPPDVLLKNIGYLARELKTPAAQEIAMDLIQSSSRIKQQQEQAFAQQQAMNEQQMTLNMQQIPQ